MTGLPAQLTHLIGRETDIEQAAQLLLDARLLTLTGPGGSGKTRLAIAIGERVQDRFPAGVTFVPLASLTDTALVGPTIMRTLDLVPTRSQSAVEQLIAGLVTRQTLLILDNFEQVIDAATLVSDLLANCPHLTVCVTSRVMLHLSGEQELPVPPLMLPKTSQVLNVADLQRNPAVSLFVQRARAVNPHFELTSANASATAEICQRVDGLPLAIELAAARIRLLTPQAMAARMTHRLALLTGGPRDAPARQQTLYDTIDWSYALLPPETQQLFRSLGVFAGGWTLDAAEAICQPSASGLDVFDGISFLIEQNLVRQVDQPDGEMRYTMLETIREFAVDQLEATDEAEQVRDRHAAWFSGLGERFLPYPPAGLDIALRADRIEAELDNLRAVVAWQLTRDVGSVLRLAISLLSFWEVRSYYSEAIRWLETGLAHADADALSEHLLATANGVLADMDVWQGGFELADRLEHDILPTFERLGDRRGTYQTLFSLARIIWFTGDFDRAAHLFERCIHLQREAGDWFGVAGAIGNLGGIAHDRDDLDRAVELMEEALALTRAHDFVPQSVIWITALGLVRLERGEYEQARALLTESLEYERQLHFRRMALDALEGMAMLAIYDGQRDRAAQLWSAIATMRRTFSLPARPINVAENERVLSELESTLGTERFAEVWAAGSGMSLDEAIDFAIEPVAVAVPVEQPSAVVSPLSKRELEVLRLLVEGQSNQEIAIELFISPNTVTNHVTNILNKLGLDSRTAAATYALRHGLV